MAIIISGNRITALLCIKDAEVCCWPSIEEVPLLALQLWQSKCHWGWAGIPAWKPAGTFPAVPSCSDLSPKVTQGGGWALITAQGYKMCSRSLTGTQGLRGNLELRQDLSQVLVQLTPPGL